MAHNERTFVAVIGLDEGNISECLDDYEEIYEPGSYLEREMGWLTESGIRLKDWFIADIDDESNWARYINYLVSWAFSHLEDEFEGMTPASFNEWLSNENIEETNL